MRTLLRSVLLHVETGRMIRRVLILVVALLLPAQALADGCVLLETGTDYLLLEDGTSRILLETDTLCGAGGGPTVVPQRTLIGVGV